MSLTVTFILSTFYCCCLVAKSRPTLCNPTDCSTAGLPAPHHLSEVAQVHVHWISDAIQPSHPLMPSSSLNLSQHQGLFQWISSSHQVAKILEFSIIPSNEYSGLISFRIDWFDLLASKRLSKVFFSTTVWKHQFFGTQAFLWTNSHFHLWLLEKP